MVFVFLLSVVFLLAFYIGSKYIRKGSLDEKMEKGKKRKGEKVVPTKKKNSQKTLDNSTFELLVSSLRQSNLRVGMALQLERNRAIEDKVGVVLVLNKLLMELKDEINKNVVGAGRHSWLEQIGKVEEMVIRYEIRYSECELYDKNLTTALKEYKRRIRLQRKGKQASDQNQVTSSSETDATVEQLDNLALPLQSSPIGKILLCTAECGTMSSSSPALSSGSSLTCLSGMSLEKRRRVKDWRKPTASVRKNPKDFSGPLEVLTAENMGTRQKLDALTEQLNIELIRRANLSKRPSHAMQKKMHNLQAEIKRCQEEYDRDVLFTRYIYHTATLARESSFRVLVSQDEQMCEDLERWERYQKGKAPYDGIKQAEHSF